MGDSDFYLAGRSIHQLSVIGSFSIVDLQCDKIN